MLWLFFKKKNYFVIRNYELYLKRVLGYFLFLHPSQYRNPLHLKTFHFQFGHNKNGRQPILSTRNRKRPNQKEEFNYKIQVPCYQRCFQALLRCIKRCLCFSLENGQFRGYFWNSARLPFVVPFFPKNISNRSRFTVTSKSSSKNYSKVGLVHLGKNMQPWFGSLVLW